MKINFWKKKNINTVKKILVIRFSSIGDIVLTTPVFRCLKLQMPTVEIHFLTKLAFKQVTEANPYIDQFYYLDNNLNELIPKLKLEQYDCIVDLHKNFRSFKIKQSLRCRTLTFKKQTISKFLLTKFHINLMSGKHITQRSIDTVLPLGIKNDGKGLDYFLPKNMSISVADLPAQHRFGFVAIVIGASYYTKKLPVEELQLLCTMIEYPIVLIGGKEDTEEGDEVAKISPFKIYNACGKFSLNESAWLVRESKVVISHDTGLLYIACAFNKQVLAIWGGTSPKLDVEPYYGSNNLQKGGAKYKNFIVEGLSCQPCSNYGSKKCPKKYFDCMKKQNLSLIAQTAMEFCKK
jgi:ADP-heptose:LPS heptosyltransferase